MRRIRHTRRGAAGFSVGGESIAPLEFQYCSEITPEIDLSRSLTSGNDTIKALRRRVLRRLSSGFELVRYSISDFRGVGPRVVTMPVVVRHCSDVNVGSGGLARIVYLEGRPSAEIARENVVTHQLTYTPTTSAGTPGQKVQRAFFGPRGSPIGEGHIVIGDATRRQELSRQTAELFLSVLMLLGERYEGFFGGVAPTHPEILHAHYWKRKLGIWKMTDRWPLPISVWNRRGLADTAAWMAHEAARFGAQQKDIDLAFRFSGDTYEVVCVPRRRGRAKPLRTLAGGDERRYDRDFTTFGVLEMTGYVVSIKTSGGYRMLTENPSLYERSLYELCE